MHQGVVRRATGRHDGRHARTARPRRPSAGDRRPTRARGPGPRRDRVAWGRRRATGRPRRGAPRHPGGGPAARRRAARVRRGGAGPACRHRDAGDLPAAQRLLSAALAGCYTSLTADDPLTVTVGRHLADLDTAPARQAGWTAHQDPAPPRPDAIWPDEQATSDAIAAALRRPDPSAPAPPPDPRTKARVPPPPAPGMGSNPQATTHVTYPGAGTGTGAGTSAAARAGVGPGVGTGAGTGTAARAGTGSGMGMGMGMGMGSGTGVG